MSQRLKTMTRTDGNATGIATRLNNGSRNNLSIIDIFRNIFFGKPIENKVTDGESKNKIRDYFTRQTQD